MKNICLLLSCIFAPLWLMAQDITTTPISNILKRDAIQLAARYLEKNEVVEELPQYLIDSIATILNKIIHSELPQSAIVEELNIHTQSSVDVYNIRFFADSETSWVKHYLNNQDIIPEALSFLFLNYSGLHLSLVKAGPLYTEFNLESEYPMHMANFGKQLSNLPGIDMVIVGNNDTNHNTNNTDIRLQRVANAWLVTYCYGVQNGQINYIWQFALEDLDNSVQFITEQGTNPPNLNKNNTTL